MEEKLPGWPSWNFKSFYEVGCAYDMYIQSYHENGVNWATMKKTEYPNVQVKTSLKTYGCYEKGNPELLEENGGQILLAKEIIGSQRNILQTTRVWTKYPDRSVSWQCDSLGELNLLQGEKALDECFSSTCKRFISSAFSFKQSGAFIATPIRL